MLLYESTFFFYKQIKTKVKNISVSFSSTYPWE